MDFVLEVCEAVKAAWKPSIQNPIIFNLPPQSSADRQIDMPTRSSISVPIFPNGRLFVYLFTLTTIVAALLQQQN